VWPISSTSLPNFIFIISSITSPVTCFILLFILVILLIQPDKRSRGKRRKEDDSAADLVRNLDRGHIAGTCWGPRRRPPWPRGRSSTCSCSLYVKWKGHAWTFWPRLVSARNEQNEKCTYIEDADDIHEQELDSDWYLGTDYNLVTKLTFGGPKSQFSCDQTNIWRRKIFEPFESRILSEDRLPRGAEDMDRTSRLRRTRSATWSTSAASRLRSASSTFDLSSSWYCDATKVDYNE
jgi:hypothetical protein